MKMFFEVLLSIIIVIILIYLFFSFAKVTFSPGPKQHLSGSVCAGNDCFSVEVAKTKAQIEGGLMHRKELDKNRGMLFVFEKEGIHPFWMKNTLIPLDIIWIDSGNKVVFISQNVRPCKSLICPSIVPSGPAGGCPAKYVLELNAGTCQKIGLKVGDGLDMDFYGIID